MYFPDDGQIQVHQQCVTKCPPELIAGYYWYGPKKHSAGKIPSWVTTLYMTQTEEGTIRSTSECGHDEISETGGDNSIQPTVVDAEQTNSIDPAALDGEEDSSVANECEDAESDVMESTGLAALQRHVPHMCLYNHHHSKKYLFNDA